MCNRYLFTDMKCLVERIYFDSECEEEEEEEEDLNRLSIRRCYEKRTTHHRAALARQRPSGPTDRGVGVASGAKELFTT